jgi:hypothetical protein
LVAWAGSGLSRTDGLDNRALRFRTRTLGGLLRALSGDHRTHRGCRTNRWQERTDGGYLRALGILGRALGLLDRALRGDTDA